MRFFGTVTNLGQPGQKQTPVTEDVFAAIGAAMSEAQTCVRSGSKIRWDVWMESANLKGPAHAWQIGGTVDASKLPSLLLAMPTGAGQLALGDGAEERKAPAIVACPVCAEGVADLVDGTGLVWRYRCDNPKCAFEPTFSPSQCGEWLGKALIRSDRARLQNPKNEYDDKSDPNVTPLVSYREGRTVRLLGARKTYGDKYDVNVYMPSGKPVKGARVCRQAKSIKDARALAGTVVTVTEGLDAIDYHDALCAKAVATHRWEPLPEAYATLEELPKAFAWLGDNGERCVITYAVDGGTKRCSCSRPAIKGDVANLDYDAKGIKLSNIVSIYVSLSAADYGKDQEFVLYKLEGWTPPAPEAQPEKNAKGKKAKAEPAAAAEVEGNPTINVRLAKALSAETIGRIGVLSRWSAYISERDPKAACLVDIAAVSFTLGRGAELSGYDSLIEELRTAYPLGPSAIAEDGALRRAQAIDEVLGWKGILQADDATETDAEKEDLLNATNKCLEDGDWAAMEIVTLINRCRNAYPGLDPAAVAEEGAAKS